MDDEVAVMLHQCIFYSQRNLWYFVQEMGPALGLELGYWLGIPDWHKKSKFGLMVKYLLQLYIRNNNHDAIYHTIVALESLLLSQTTIETLGREYIETIIQYMKVGIPLHTRKR